MKILWFGFEKKLGVEMQHSTWKTNKENWDFDQILNYRPDLIIEREFNDGKSIYTGELELLKERFPKAKTAVWLIDTHVSYKRHLEYSKNFDYVFMAISKYVDEFKKQNLNTFWLPLCFPLADVPQYDDETIYPIGFVGRFNVRYLEERTKFLEAIKKEYNGMCHFVTDYQTVYQTMSHCDIMVNKSFASDLNFRVFEALAMNNALVTNQVPDLYKIKGLKEKVNIYKTTEEAIALIKKLSFKVERPDTSKYIKSYHTLTHRINSMLKMIETREQAEF